jgi:hypothetical protein
MSDNPIYRANPRIVFPGSRLEKICEALADLQEHTPGLYSQQVAEAHQLAWAVLTGAKQSDDLYQLLTKAS